MNLRWIRNLPPFEVDEHDFIMAYPVFNALIEKNTIIIPKTNPVHLSLLLKRKIQLLLKLTKQDNSILLLGS